MRRAFGMRILSSSAAPVRRGPRPLSSKPYESISSERSAFCSDSLKVRPMAIASPTDFIWVVRTSGVWLNFSKVKRGILVTT